MTRPHCYAVAVVKECRCGREKVCRCAGRASETCVGGLECALVMRERERGMKMRARAGDELSGTGGYVWCSNREGCENVDSSDEDGEEHIKVTVNVKTQLNRVYI
ncbi:uncharacterized protein LOC116853258 [Odontomachus brunneus]|uniref:uncharacterized protein LOC116853258 n=1 Tax=Odontomachus brunneus TaxID=486640 RepID=UPI0013F1BEC2|nr:uncharacterized protein LOC116853258 [Odontomachus brunneus]